MNSQNPDTPALCFRSAEDAIDYAHHLTQDGNRRLAAQSVDAVDRYIEGDVCLVVRFYSRSDSLQIRSRIFQGPTWGF